MNNDENNRVKWGDRAWHLFLALTLANFVILIGTEIFAVISKNEWLIILSKTAGAGIGSYFLLRLFPSFFLPFIKKWAEQFDQSSNSSW